MKLRSAIYSVALLLVLAGCNSGHDTDSLANRAPAAVTTLDCLRCHSSSFSPDLDPVVTNGTGTAGKHGRHVGSLGLPCERCHTGYYWSATHMNGTFDTGNAAVLLVGFDPVNPGGLWTNDTGTGTGTCSSVVCHNNDPLDWYGTNTWSLPLCTICHSAAINLRRAVTGTGGDFGANAAMLSHHVSGTADPTPAQCQVCHDMSRHMGGGVRLKEADTGAAIAYDPSVTSTLEPFCLSCHDPGGAVVTFNTVSGGTPTSPFNDGRVMGSSPYPSAARIATSWASTNGHGPNGNHALGERLTCLGTGQPGTGCHGSGGSVNAHGSVNQVLAARPFRYDNDDVYAEADFALCFDCHANYPGFTKEDILGVQAGGILDWEYNMSPSGGRGPNGWAPPYTIPFVLTHFADHNEPGGLYNDAGFWGDNMNLHWAHLGILTSDFRGTGATTGINCVNCHDVHGSPTAYGATYAEMGYVNEFPDMMNRLGRMSDNAYLTNQLDIYPTYCAFNCHSIQGQSRAWYYPIAE